MFQRGAHVTFQDLGGSEGGVLLHLDTAGYFNLNATGVLVWRLLEEPTRLDEIVRDIAQVFEDAPPSLQRDVEHFLEEMVARDLVRRVEDRPSGDEARDEDRGPRGRAARDVEPPTEEDDSGTR